MLDQVVVGVAGEGQGVEAERVHRGQVEQPQPGLGGPQVGEVEVDQVVSQQEVRALGQLVQPGQGLGQVAAHPGDRHRLTRIRTDSGNRVNPVIRPADLQVQG